MPETRLQNAVRVSDLNCNRDLPIKSRAGASESQPFQHSSSNLIQESASAGAKSAKSLEGHCTKVDTLSDGRVLERFLFFGKLGGGA